MGHYRSEMGFEEEDRKKAEHDAKRKAFIQANIEADIAKNGIAAVLTKIVTIETYEMRGIRSHYDWNPADFKERFLCD